MSQSNLTSNLASVMGNLERIEIDLGSIGAVKVSSLSGTEEVSKPFELVGVARVPVSPLLGGSGAVRPERVVGDWATIILRDAWGSERRIRGLVSDAQVEVLEVGEATLRFVVKASFFRLTLGASCRAFQDMDVLEIAKDVLSRTETDVRFEARGSYAKREYTVQYNESDFDFISRLFEEEGIYYWFDHAEGSIMVVADHSPSADLIDDLGWKSGAPTGALVPYKSENGLEANTAFVRELGAKPGARAAKFTVGSFDFVKPSFKLAAEAMGLDVGAIAASALEVYDAPGAGSDDPKVLAARVRVGAERAKAEAARTNGVTASVRITPGRVFELSGHPFGRLDGRYFVTKTSFSIDNVGGLGASGKPIDVTFTAIPDALPFRPAPVTAAPKHPGLQTGVVVGPSGQEIHTDEHGRVRLQQHWDREGQKNDKSGRWVRVAQRGVGGSMMFPRMGWNILSFGEEGSVDLPIAMSRTYDGEHMPPYALPGNKTQTVYKTATTPNDGGGGGGGGGGTANEIRFESKKGSEEFFVNSTGDMNVLVKNVKGEVIHGNMLHTVGVDHTLTVGGTYDTHVVGNQTVSVGANQSESVTGTDRQKLVNGSETIKIGAMRTLKTGVNVDTAGTSRSLKVGAVHMSATLGAIKAQAKMVNQLVGGAVVKATPRKMTESVGSEVNADTAIGMLPAKAAAAAGKLKSLPGVSAQLSKLKAKVGIAIQTIGVLKFEKAKDRKIESKGTYTEKVLGTMELVTEKGAMTDSANALWELLTKTLTVTGKSIVLDGTDELEIKCGASSIVLNADGIKIDSPEIQLGKAAGFSVCHTEIQINPK